MRYPSLVFLLFHHFPFLLDAHRCLSACTRPPLSTGNSKLREQRGEREEGRKEGRRGTIKDGGGWKWAEKRRQKGTNTIPGISADQAMSRGGNGRATKHRIKETEISSRWIRLTDFTRSLLTFPDFKFAFAHSKAKVSWIESERDPTFFHPPSIIEIHRRWKMTRGWGQSSFSLFSPLFIANIESQGTESSWLTIQSNERLTGGGYNTQFHTRPSTDLFPGFSRAASCRKLLLLPGERYAYENRGGRFFRPCGLAESRPTLIHHFGGFFCHSSADWWRKS